jgi:hypothetical protein
MKTAKDLAFKAYRSHIKEYGNNPTAETENSFECWWNYNFANKISNYDDLFCSELDVFIDGKRYIQAE